MKKNINISIEDNGSAFLLVMTNNSEQRFVMSAYQSLGDAWLYQIESQEFTVSKKEIPVTEWINGMKQAGYIE